MNEKLNIRLVLGLAVILFFPLLSIYYIGYSTVTPFPDIPVDTNAWLYVEYGLDGSNLDRFIPVELDDFYHLPVLYDALRVGETPVDHVMIRYNGMEARNAVFFLSKVKGLEDRMRSDSEGRMHFVYSVKVEDRYTFIRIVFGNTRPLML